jgi:thioredoxin reductase (NADPH)
VIVHGRLLRNPSNAELAAAVGFPAPSGPLASCDLLVAGSGPAGLSAAVYGASKGTRVIVMDATAAGSQAGTSSRIENYLGFPSAISGAKLAERALVQAQKSAPGPPSRPGPPHRARTTVTTGCASATGPA